MLMLMHNRLIIMTATVLLVILNVIHPFIHGFEGGALDANLTFMNAWAGFALNEQ